MKIVMYFRGVSFETALKLIVKDVYYGQCVAAAPASGLKWLGWSGRTLFAVHSSFSSLLKKSKLLQM